MSRTKQILDSIDSLIHVHDAWEADDTAPVQPTAEFEAAIEYAIQTCDFGDIPSQCRDLCLAVSRLAEEWRQYANGIAGKRTPDHRPVGAFWAAFRNVVTCRSHAEPQAVKQPEPVSILLESKVSPRQIAFHIWGYRGKGPFITAAGQVDEAKIREEAKEPGKHTKDWVHPEQLERQREQTRILQTRLGAITSREESDRPTVEKASVLEMLREGQYPDVIARVKRVPLQEVLAEANRNGITPAIRPNLAAMRAPHEPAVIGADVATTESGSSSDDFGAVEIEQESDESEQSVEDLIRELNDGKRGAPEIVAACRDRGLNVTFQQVKAALKPAKAGK